MDKNDFRNIHGAYLAHYGIPGMKWRNSKFIGKIRKGGRDIYQYATNAGHNIENAIANRGRNNNTTMGRISGAGNAALNKLRMKGRYAQAKGYAQKGLSRLKSWAQGIKSRLLNVGRNFRNARAVNDTNATMERLRQKYTASGRVEAGTKAYNERMAQVNAARSAYGLDGKRPKNYNQRMFQESGGNNPNNRRKAKTHAQSGARLGAYPGGYSGKRPKNYNQRMMQDSGGYNPNYTTYKNKKKKRY